MELRDSTGLSVDEVKHARKNIKSSARRDKNVCAQTKLAQDYESAPSQWNTVRKLCSDFKPRAPGLKDSEGKLRPKQRRAELFRQYLSERVWRQAVPSICSQSPIYPEIPDIFRPCTEDELLTSLQRLATGKAPGPDGIPAELAKRMPCVVRVFVLSHFNKCLSAGTVPDSWLLSEVVMLIKDARKDSLSMDNYRPISLTDVLCKTYASLLQKRLAFYIDPRICEHQYGFRRTRSTSQPIHILRRLIETHERQEAPLHVIVRLGKGI